MARKSRKQTAAPMPAPSLYVHVALYIRLSVEDNKKRGCSVENQKLVLNDFLSDKPDFVVYDTYIDNGATGTNFHRPGFQQMLSDIEAGHINCVIVKDLSRLGRNSIDTGYYIEQYFHAHNVRFIAVTDQFDTADSGNLHGGIMLPLKNMINEAYDTELVQAKNVHAVITAQTKQIKSDYEIKLKQQEIVQEVGNANMLTKALIDRLINKVYVFPGDRIEIEYATQDFLETKESEKEV